MKVTLIMYFNHSFTTIMENISKSLQKGSGWIISSSYIKLPKELDHPRKGLINIQNTDDNEQ